MNIEPIREKNLLLTTKFPVLTLNYSDKIVQAIYNGRSLQKHHVYCELKRRWNDRFHIVSTWNTRGICRIQIKH